MGPAMLGIVGIVDMLPGMFGNGGIPDMFDMLGIGGIGAPPAEGGSCPPAGDLTADTNADIDTGETWETPKFGGGWFISAVDRFNFGILEPVWKGNDTMWLEKAFFFLLRRSYGFTLPLKNIRILFNFQCLV